MERLQAWLNVQSEYFGTGQQSPNDAITLEQLMPGEPNAVWRVS